MERCATGGCGVIWVAVVAFWGVFFERGRFEGDSGDAKTLGKLTTELEFDERMLHIRTGAGGAR